MAAIGRGGRRGKQSDGTPFGWWCRYEEFEAVKQKQRKQKRVIPMPFKKTSEMTIRKQTEELMTAIAQRVNYTRDELRRMDVVDYQIMIESLGKQN